jgi:aspartyl/asparaginyl beta-hydroxylase (cupin superfamily)
VQLIETHSTVRTMAGLTYVSKMAPGTHVAAHCGPTNLRLRCHLGIQVPEGDCAIRVGDELRGWREGKCVVFDDSLEHESWNHTAETRIVLIIDLWHPDLAPEEIVLLEGLHNYSSAQAESLTRYWIANAKARNARRVHYD